MKPWASAAAATSAESGRDRSRPIEQARPRTSGRARRRPARHGGARPRGGVLEQAVLLDGVEDGERGGAGDRVAAEGGAVVAGLQQGRRRSPSATQAPIGMPPPRPLARVTTSASATGRGEPLAGAADAGLHLVEPEQRAVVAGDLAGRRRGSGGRDDHARLALDGFEDDGCRLVGDGLGERGLVAVRHEGDVAGQRLEGRAVRLLGRSARATPMVRPWKEPSAATRCVRPVRRVSLKAASLASVPELVKNTRPSAATSESSRSASSTWGALVKKFETWPRVASCSVTAATSAGWAWPSALTAMPPSRSTYSLPSASQTCAPSPRTRTSFGGPKVFISGAGVALAASCWRS